MKIEKLLEDGKLCLTVEGRLDSTTAPELEKEIEDSIEGVEDLTFDFNNLEYISSAGLRVLLVAQKIMKNQGEMRVTGLNEEVKEIFDVTGFSDILTVE